MPLIEEEPSPGTVPEISTSLEAVVARRQMDSDPGMFRIGQAALEQGNSLSTAATNGFGLAFNFQPEAGYDPFKDPHVIARPELMQFVSESRSFQETAHLIAKVDREEENNRILQEGGWRAGVSLMAAGALDPVLWGAMLIPGLREVRGASIMRTGLKLALQGAAGETGAEVVKSAAQETRTLDESVTNIGIATLASGILGAGIHALSNVQKAKAEKALKSMLTEEPKTVAQVELETLKAGLEKQKLVGGAGIEKIEISPLSRTLNSPSPKVRSIAEDLVEHSWPTKKNVKGIATPIAVETRIKSWDSNAAKFLEGLDDAYLDYRRTKPEIPLNKDDFKDLVGDAMSNGDRHIIPEVEKAAKMARTTIADPVKKEAVAQGLMEAEGQVVGAESYRPRVYNHKLIAAREPEFRKLLTTWLKEEQLAARRSLPEYQLKMDNALLARKKAFKKGWNKIGEPGKVLAEAEVVLSEAESAFSKASARANASPDELAMTARDIVDRIQGLPAGSSAPMMTLTRGPFRERVMNITDNRLGDFLVRDVEKLMKGLLRSTVPDIELARKFGKNFLVGNADESENILKIRNEYTTLKDAATGNEKELTRLGELEKQDIIDLIAMRDRLRGTYKMPDNPDGWVHRTGRIARHVNFLRMMGGVALSSVPDLAMPIFVNGMKPFGEALASLAMAPRTFNLARKEIMENSVGLDMVLNSRAMSMNELMDTFERGTKLERGLEKASQYYGKFSLITYWNGIMKQWSGVIVMNNILDAAVKSTAGNAPKGVITRLANSGIDNKMAKRIAKQFSEHGDHDVIRLANSDMWDDMGAADAFRMAILKDSDRTIITPGVGERPLWMSSESGKLVGQFKTFAISAHHKMLVPALQYRDARVLTGIVAGTALGALSYYMKELIANREPSTNPAKLIVEGVDKSGIVGFVGDVNNIIEKATDGGIGINPAIGEQPMSRYSDVGFLGAALGPSVEALVDVHKTSTAVSKNEYKRSSIHAARKLIPGQNLFYVRNQFDKLEEEAYIGLNY